MSSESERLQSELEPLELVTETETMSEKALKEKLATMDAMIKVKAADIEDAQLDLRHLIEKRRAFARRNCKHARTYQRSIMGREMETRCEICNEPL